MREEPNSSKRVLDPIERISEVLFGLIMALTFTCSFSVATANRGHVREMLTGALGCNLAWGIIDAVFYLMGCLSERGHSLVTVRQVRQAADVRKAHRIIAEALPPVLRPALDASELERLRQELVQMPEPPARARLKKDDWRGALGVFLLVFLSTLPPVIPFFFLRDARLALRLSNGLAIVMLFMAGYLFADYAGYRPWRVGVAMVLLGGAMVGITIAFGG